MNYNELEISRIKYARVAYYNPDWESWEEIDEDDYKVFHQFEEPEVSSIALLYQTDNGYINIFNPEEKCNVFKWDPIAKPEPKLGVGMRVFLRYACLSGKADGKCYLLSSREFLPQDPSKKTISFEQLIKRVTSDKKTFYVDRLDLAKKDKSMKLKEKLQITYTDYANQKKYSEFCSKKEMARIRR